MGLAANKVVPVGVVVRDVPSLIPKAIMWWKKFGDIEPELSRHVGKKPS
ncbi:MAG: hypothetical protein U9R43_05675 [Thermodesulfobacteriota bacterium]|nr:hypothetical protein [Thermodesulfobacteriota bacterium]